MGCNVDMNKQPNSPKKISWSQIAKKPASETYPTISRPLPTFEEAKPLPVKKPLAASKPSTFSSRTTRLGWRRIRKSLERSKSSLDTLCTLNLKLQGDFWLPVMFWLGMLGLLSRKWTASLPFSPTND